ncbi:L-threonylcarbamoyladenylate synthase [Acetivibrio cellulolyticus]|uniref:L-threonylcarbamoyladenylate synthase n=1 Tax=Acetivibrio cellulolyticus TaxID=35830 RepID=UPI0001E2C71B|nr:L-threonylcarbamoyladenylate synthase [Acetivibrio cellulolyticus]
MKTEIIEINSGNIDISKIRYASQVLKDGGLVAFPTETVYGLGANALNKEAVERIFIAKGRPSDNPLIVHVADKRSVEKLVSHIPNKASILMDKFWPGPLTLVMDKLPIIPEVITAGLDTVAIRVPSHPIALALIREAELPVAAPSANVSGKPSPTDSRHVINDLNGKVDVIIDGGFSDIGVESTVVDMVLDPPMLLRPGGITVEQLEDVLGQIQIDPTLVKKNLDDIIIPRSPGMKYKHYAPKADVIIVEGDPEKIAVRINEMVKEYEGKDIKVGILATDETVHLYPESLAVSLGSRLSPGTIAANLFKALRDFDKTDVQMIFAESVDSSGIGLAIMNRMKKAAGYNIIKI